MLRTSYEQASYYDIIFLEGSSKAKPTLVDFAREFVNKKNPDFITDDVANGELACAKVVSTILMKAGMLDHVLVNVEQLTRYIKVLGWHETQQAHIGDIVVWDRTTEYANLHIGIVSNDDLAINNSSYEKMPVESSISERPVLYYLSPVETPVIMKEQEAMPDATLDLDKLAMAVSHAETGGCKTGMALSKNNCFGIMQWSKTGVRSGKAFATHQDSFDEFKKIWSTHYKAFPDQSLADRWVNGGKGGTTDESRLWLGIVKKYYYK